MSNFPITRKRMIRVSRDSLVSVVVVGACSSREGMCSLLQSYSDFYPWYHSPSHEFLSIRPNAGRLTYFLSGKALKYTFQVDLSSF